MKTVKMLPTLLTHLPTRRPRRAISIISVINATEAKINIAWLLAIQAARGAA